MAVIASLVYAETALCLLSFQPSTAATRIVPVRSAAAHDPPMGGTTGPIGTT
ncbi:MAG: hypothetical protein JW852_08645 [Spirochaetales bacterium]|nr:hypothetical protein [Spirochaetales bacterium]